VAVPQSATAVASYPAATLDTSEHPGSAKDFVAWLRSPAARELLQAAGFERP
jgi:molybdate transport system substrate-binding protein